MNLFDIKFIGTIAKKDPVIARALEIGIYAVVNFLLGALISYLAQFELVWSLAVSQFLVPLQAAFGKKLRDAKEKLAHENNDEL